MADFKATAQLNIETVTDQAQSDVLALSELMRRKLNPKEFGEFTPTQDAALEQALQSRGASLETPMTADETRKVLEDALALEDKLLQIKNQQNAAQEEQNKKAEKARLEGELLKQQKDEALQLMNMQNGSWREINRNARAVLEDEKSTAEERAKALAALDKYQEHVKTQQRLNTAIKGEVKSRERIEQLSKQHEDTMIAIRDTLLKVAATEEEKELIQRRFIPNLEREFEARKEMARAQEESLRLSKEEAKAKQEIQDAEADMKDTFAGKITSAYLYYQALNAVKRVVREAISTITELDKTLTDIAVVTSFSREEAWGLLGTYQEMAKQVGLTTTEVAELSIAFFRQGREAADALELTRTAAEFAKIAAINVNDAANFLTAAINGFNLAASDATRIIDRFAALGASAAASAQEIAIALSKVAPAAASAGVEVDTLMAFITKGIETTREAPENIGTAFKTVFARMRQLTDIGTTIEDGVNVNRVEDSLKSIGVELRDANGFFRDLDDVLIEVGKRWDSINRNQQAYVATTLAGTRQQTRLIALFEDFDRTLELIEVSQDSAGAAAIQHAEFMTGLEAATTRLRTSFQQLITSFVNSDVVIAAINAINTVLEMMNTTLGKLVLTAGTLFGSFRLLTKSSKIKEFGESIVKALSVTVASEADKVQLSFGLISRSWNSLIGSFQKGGQIGLRALSLVGRYITTVFTKGPIVAQQKAISKVNALLMSNAAIKKFVTYVTGGFTTATNANTTAVAANNAQLALNPYVAIAMAIIAVVSALALFIKKIRDADGTTSKFISGLKQFFDNVARFINNTVKAIGDAFKKVFDAINNMPGWLKTVLNVLMLFVPGLRLIGAFNLTKQLFGALGINLQRPISKAASEMRVLQNEVKDLNKEIVESKKEMAKLEKGIEEYERLQKIVFKTKQETEELVAAQERLQELLGTDLTGIGLEILARGEIERQRKNLEDNIKKLEDTFDIYAEENKGVGWEVAFADEQFEEFLDTIPAYAQQIAKQMAQGFEDAAPEVQEAFLATVASLPGQALDFIEQELTTKPIRIEAASGEFINLEAGLSKEEIRQRVNEAGFIDGNFQFNRRLRDSGAEFANVGGDIYLDTIAQAREANNLLFSDFEAGLAAIQDLNLEAMAPALVDAVNLAFPSITRVASLGEDMATRIGKAGGVAAVNAIQPVLNELDSLVVKPTVEINRGAINDEAYETIVSTAEENAAIVQEAILQAATSENVYEAIYNLWSEAVSTGVIDGVELDPETSNKFKTSLENFFTDIDLNNVTTEIDKINKDFQELSEIIKKAPNQLATEDLDLLMTYPELFEDYMNGAVTNLNDYFATAREGVSDTLDGFQSAIDFAKMALDVKLESGVIDQEAYDSQLAFLNIQENQIDALRQMKNANSQNIDAIKAQIDSYKSAFAEAKKIRDLQKQSAEITQKSIDAIRNGATGTIEAEFNRTRLNQEIADANRALQENMLVAQLEAQQKVLEDQQQRKIQKATEENTTALVQSKMSLDNLASVMDGIFSNRQSVTIQTTAGPVQIDPFEFFNIQSDINS